MSECNTYTGDLSIGINGEGDWDIKYFNGQPCMNDSFDTMLTLALFGEPDFWQNELTNDPNEKYISEFSEVIREGKVSNKTINDGNSAIKKALQFMINSGMAISINVIGSLISVYAIQWIIEIERDDTSSKYTVNWNKGVIGAVTSNT